MANTMTKKISILITVLALVGLGVFVELKKEKPVEESLVFGDAGWLSGWEKRIKLDIDYTNKIGDSVTWFPVTIFLKDGNGESIKVFEEVGDNCRKIAITKADGITELKGEIDLWDYDSETPSNSVGIIHTSADGWTINDDTSIYLYYDNSHADNPNIGDDPDDTASNAVWDNNYVMIQHLKDATTSTTKDSTSNDNDGTKKAANEPIVTTDGKIDDAQSFDGSNDKITVSDKDCLDIQNAISIEFWVKLAKDVPDQTDAYPSVVYKFRGGSSYQEGYDVYFVKSLDALALKLGWGSGSKSFINVDVSSWEVGEWHHVVFTYDVEAWQMTCYFEGGWVDEKATSNKPIATNDLNLVMGYGYSNPFEGAIDEVRISNISRSPAWIKASYNSGNDSLLSYGTEEVGEKKRRIIEVE